MSVRARRWGWRLLLPVLCVLVLGTQLSPFTQAAEPPSSDLSLDMTDRVDPVAVGNTITYDLRFRNNGPNDAAGMRIVDQLPAQVEFFNAQASHNGTCTADGSTVTCAGFNPIPDNGQGIVHINVTAKAAGTAHNTAVISSDSDDPNSSNNDSDESTTILPQAQGDLEATKSGPSEVTVGTTFSYQLRAINHGPHTARGVKLTDQLPSGVEYAGATTGCANSGGTVTCTAGSLPDDAFYDATINVRAATAGTVSNTATASGDTDDPNSSNDQSAAVVTLIKEAPVPQADLSTTKSGPASAKNGETFSYGLTVTNAGPDAASGASVSDLLPSGAQFVSASPGCANNSGTVTCSLGTMAPGSSNFTITVMATSAGTLTNTATATSSTQDPDGNNNTSNSVATEVAPVADLSLSKSGPADAETGESLTYTLNVANAGPDAAAGVTVSDTLPSSLTFGSSDDCTHLEGTVTCALGTIASGGGDSASFTATANDAGQVVNSASVSSDTHDPSNGNNSGSATTTVSDPPPSPTPTEEPTPTPTEEPTPTPTEEPTPTPTEEPTPTPTQEPTPTPTEEPTPTPTEEPTPTPTEESTPPPAIETSEPTPTTSAQAEPPPEPIDGCPTSARQAAGFPSDGLLAFVPAAIQLEQQRRRKLSLVDDRPSAQKGGKRSRSKVIKIVAVIAGLAVAAVVGVLMLTGGDKGKNYATLGGLEGRVDLQKPEEAFEPATKAATLDIGDKVRTGDDGLARIDYTDGSLTRLDHNTTFQVQELINNSTHKSIKTNLDVGRVWNRVEKLTKQDDRFEVETVTAVATVHGTTFVIDCRFNGGQECSHIGIEGTFGVETDLGDTGDVSSGECQTEDGNDLGPCRFTKEELKNDPFFKEAAALDIKEKGDVIVLPQIFGEDKKVALVPVEEPQVQAAEATPATSAPATEEPACQTGEPASRGTSLPLAGAIALMVIFFGVAWARPNRKSDPAGDSAN